MGHALEAAILTLPVFATTNLDDMVLPLTIFAHREYRTTEIVAGQFVGLGARTGLSLARASLSVLAASGRVGLLALLPIAVGEAASGTGRRRRTRHPCHLRRYDRQRDRQYRRALLAVRLLGDRMMILPCSSS
jgi:cadmium resistance protein CadD (predicted permease)